MKIRNGLVTNSSSTSFLISLKKDWEKESFMSAIGANKQSSIYQLFEDLFDSVDNNKKEIHLAIKEMCDEETTVSDFLKQMGFDTETIEVAEKLIKDGRTVYFGELYSDAEKPAERYFCCRSFIVSEDDIYFNGNIGGW